MYSTWPMQLDPEATAAASRVVVARLRPADIARRERATVRRDKIDAVDAIERRRIDHLDPHHVTLGAGASFVL